MRNFLAISIALLLCGASCRPLPEDKSAFASEAGESTIVLGSCKSDFSKGWEACLVEKGSASFPTLRFVMTNKGEYAVSDCELGLFKTGVVNSAGLVEVDLSDLRPQLDKNGLCILKIETVERYPDPRDKNQLRSIYMRGGFFLEQVDAGYFPTPSNDVLAFCVTVARTTKGRTIVQKCKELPK